MAAAPFSDGIGIANLPNQVRFVVLGASGRVYGDGGANGAFGNVEAQDRRQARGALHYYGCR